MSVSPAAALTQKIRDRVEELLREGAEKGRALEAEPMRSSLFEQFVLADAAGGLVEEAEHDLSADAIAKEIAERWELARALGGDMSQMSKLPPEEFRKVRTLLTFLRMWTEWTYAWRRWEEFHRVPEGASDRE